MSRKSTNNGIIQTGGRLEADQITVGENAQSYKDVSTRPADIADDELQRIWYNLGLLQDAMIVNRSELQNIQELLGSMREVADQLTLERPDKTAILSLLDWILGSVAPISTATGLVRILKKQVVEYFVS